MQHIVEHFLGKEEVTGSIPVNGSILFIALIVFCKLRCPHGPLSPDSRANFVACNTSEEAFLILSDLLWSSSFSKPKEAD